MRHAATAPEPPAPDTDTDERGEDDADGDFGDLLPDLEEELLDDDDGGEPAQADDDPLDALPDDEGAGDDDANELDLGPDGTLDEEDADNTGDALGIDDGESAGDGEPEENLPSDDEGREGIDDERPLVSDLDLPGLDADAEGTDDGLGRFGSLVLPLERELPLATAPWSLARLSPERERCSALGAAGGSVVAGNTDLLWLAAGRGVPLRVALDGTRITSLVLVGEGRETVLCVTAPGRLVRRTRLASDAVRVAELGRIPELGAAGAHAVELCQLDADAPHSFVGRSGAGLLFRSDDAGVTLKPLEPRRVVRALSATGAPLVALGEHGSELLVSRDAGKSFTPVSLDQVARAVTAGEAPRVASAGDTVALHDPERGLVVSTDGGRSFRTATGVAAVSAAVAGAYEGRAAVWATLYSDTRDETRFVLVDAETGDARVLATLAGPGDAEGEHGTGARIDRLVWTGQELYAAGEAGFWVISPEPAPPLRPSH